MQARRASRESVALLIIDGNGVFLGRGGAGADGGRGSGGPLPGRSIEDLLAPEACRQARHYLACPEHPYGAVFEGEYRLDDDTFGSCTITIRPVAGADGTFSLAVEDARSEAERRYRSQLTETTVENLNDMIIWLDEDARYLFVNPAATRLLGYSVDELRQMRVWDVDPLFDEAKWRAHWLDVVERGSFTIETVNRSKSGVAIPIEVTVNFVEHDGRRYNCSIVRDITARKAAEAELRSLNAQILRLSITDEMTGLGNRRHFDTTLALEIARQAENGLPLSLLLLDIDSFKAFNDRYGHLDGDEALTKVARLLADAMVQPGWEACRYGGEEFACILPATGPEDALALAESLRRGIEALGIVHDASQAGRVVTASFGVVTARISAGQTNRTLLAAADRALYRAKRAGRNRVEIDSIAAGDGPGGELAGEASVIARRKRRP